ncbi:MAG: heme-binding beta-barrel domain-containing protein [Proteobacteria bacterium]|jgi:hypothetical protein|nr:heme-binding beta-barrel domain-containing protein [Pseudomonadota bacterium]
MNTADMQGIEYGPLTGLICVWTGDGGMDIAPEPDGTEHNPYFETTTFTASGDVTNAEEQVLSILHYHQIVQRKSTGKVFHDQTSYWMYNPATARCACWRVARQVTLTRMAM